MLSAEQGLQSRKKVRLLSCLLSCNSIVFLVFRSQAENWNFSSLLQSCLCIQALFDNFASHCSDEVRATDQRQKPHLLVQFNQNSHLRQWHCWSKLCSAWDGWRLDSVLTNFQELCFFSTISSFDTTFKQIFLVVEFSAITDNLLNAVSVDVLLFCNYSKYELAVKSDYLLIPPILSDFFRLNVFYLLLLRPFLNCFAHGELFDCNRVRHACAT